MSNYSGPDLFCRLGDHLFLLRWATLRKTLHIGGEVIV